MIWLVQDVSLLESELMDKYTAIKSFISTFI